MHAKHSKTISNEKCSKITTQLFCFQVTVQKTVFAFNNIKLRSTNTVTRIHCEKICIVLSVETMQTSDRHGENKQPEVLDRNRAIYHLTKNIIFNP